MRAVKLLSLFVIAASALLPGGARAATPAEFKVGFARVVIDPARPQYLGGFGYGPPVVKLASPDDHMEVRAIAIADAAGKNLVEMAIVDTQGYFSGNQEGPWGSRDARLDAAKLVAASHVVSGDVTDANMIVSSTHSHAAPTIMGIWGPTDAEYLKQVHDGTVRALVDATSNMRVANLYAATGDVSASIVEAVTQTDGYQGWPVDGRTPVLWARDPSTGATLGLYANVPVHADVVDGMDDGIISADHIGFTRRALDAALGGTSVVAMGTLGRQESIIQVRGLTHARALASYTTNAIERALGAARPITDPTVAVAQQYALVPASNPALAALNSGNLAADAATSAGGDPVTTHCAPGVDICTIDRNMLPPYAAGGAFGAWFTAARIGDVVYATEPGEAFVEVSDAIRRSVPGVDVRVIGMAQDQLGYYFPPETIPWTFFNNSDHHIYNSSLALGEINVQMQRVNAESLGFATQVTHVTSEFDDTVRAQHAGTQFFPLAVESDERTFTFDARRSGSAFGSLTQGNGWTDSFGGKITWEFGDGTTTQTNDGFVTHAFDAPGSYVVRAAVVDPRDSHVSTYDVTVTVDERFEVRAQEHGALYSLDVEGGARRALAAHWTFADGSTADGLTVAAPAGVEHGTVVAVDAAGNADTDAF
jgi:hypothetical protein